MAFSKNDGERAHVYPAPVEFEELTDDNIRSWVKNQRELRETFAPLINMFSG